MLAKSWAKAGAATAVDWVRDRFSQTLDRKLETENMDQPALSLDLDYLPKMPTNKAVGIGCIGAGFIMADCHLVAYRNAGFNPVAIASARPDQAHEVARRHGVAKVYDDYQSLLADPAVEVVDIAVPPDSTMTIIL